MVKIAGPSRPQVLLGLEVAFVVLFLAGVAMLWVPAAAMLGGALGVVAIERETARPRALQRRGGGREG